MRLAQRRLGATTFQGHVLLVMMVTREQCPMMQPALGSVVGMTPAPFSMAFLMKLFLNWTGHLLRRLSGRLREVYWKRCLMAFAAGTLADGVIRPSDGAIMLDMTLWQQRRIRS